MGCGMPILMVSAVAEPAASMPARTAAGTKRLKNLIVFVSANECVACLSDFPDVPLPCALSGHPGAGMGRCRILPAVNLCVTTYKPRDTRRVAAPGFVLFCSGRPCDIPHQGTERSQHQRADDQLDSQITKQQRHPGH